MQRIVSRKETSDVDERRILAIYTAHDRLEADLAKVSALRKTFDKYKALDSSFDVTPTLQETVDKAVVDAVTCVRLFSPNRILAGTRGLSTAATLYKQSQPPAERLRGFLDSIAAHLNGCLPYAVVLAGAHALRRISVSAADEFLRHQLNCCGLVGPIPPHDTFEAKVHMCLWQDGAAGQAELQSLLALYATCAAYSKEADGAFGSCVTALQSRLGEGVAKQLMEHYGGLRAEMQAREARLKVRDTQRAETRVVQTAAAMQRSERVTQTVAAEAAPVMQAGEAQRVGDVSVSCPPGRLSFAGWKWKAVRVVLGLLLLVLCRFVALRVWQGLAGGLRGSNLASGRRRTLTL